MLLTCKVLLLAYLKPTSEQIGCYLNGNICRCGAYVQILETIQAVVKARQGDASGPRHSDVGLRMPDLFEDGSRGRLTLCQAVVHQGGQALQALPHPRELLDNDALQQLIGGPL
jgi:hypothetical protein